MPDQYARAAPKHRGRGASRACEQCGVAFETYPYLIRRFCSRSCRSRWISAHVPRRLRSALKVTVPCPICGRAMMLLASRAKRNPTCSMTCLTAVKQQTQRRGKNRACATCEQPFWVSPSRARDGARFCSLACRDLATKAKPRQSTSRDSADYKEWRAAVYRRDNYICQRCGERSTRKKRLHAHHIKSWADYPELRFEVSNGLLLCSSCHAREHFDVAVLNGKSRT